MFWDKTNISNGSVRTEIVYGRNRRQTPSPGATSIRSTLDLKSWFEAAYFGCDEAADLLFRWYIHSYGRENIEVKPYPKRRFISREEREERQYCLKLRHPIGPMETVYLKSLPAHDPQGEDAEL